MGVINNIENLRVYLKNIPKDHIINIIAIQRKKDIPDLYKSEVLIKEYYIRSEDNFNERIDEIKKISKVFQARIYIKISPISLKEIGIELINNLYIKFKHDNFDRITSCVRSETNKMKGINRYHIIDVDKISNIDIETLDSYIYKTCEVCNIIKTKSGLHYICEPFNRTLFFEYLPFSFKPYVELLTNNLTLLYYEHN